MNSSNNQPTDKSEAKRDTSQLKYNLDGDPKSIKPGFLGTSVGQAYWDQCMMDLCQPKKISKLAKPKKK